MPVDAQPTPDGNLELVENDVPGHPQIAHHLHDGRRRNEDGTTRSPLLRYVSHFATCPNAAAHRRKEI